MPTKLSLAAVLVLTAGTATSADSIHFVNVTASRVVQTVAETTNNEKAIDIGDFDNDGDLDVVIGVALGDFGARRNKLYRNDGGVLTEITATAIPGFMDPKVSRVAFLRDYDGDGWLDIYVINDSNSHADRLFINQHPGGVFTGYQEVFGLPSNGLLGASCSGVSADFDMDGDFDVYLGNYPNNSADRMIFNNGNATFTDVTNGNVPIPGAYVVDVATGDFNGDGKIDMVVTNDGFQGAYIIYNNINGAGSGDGDFAYPNSTTQLGVSTVENAFEPGDFNGDGRLDLYWGNASGNQDRILINTGNDSTGRATWSTLPTSTLPPSVVNFASRKITAADPNKDGRVDLFVMKEGGSNLRPTLLRNTSVNGETSFVDWTEASAFPNGTIHGGWHAMFADFNGDGNDEIILGAFNNDFLFEQAPAPTFNAADLANGVVPGVFNGSATVVEATGADGDTFLIQNVSGANAFLSAIVRGGASVDLKLEVLQGANVLGVSDRGGAGVEEAIQVNNLPAGTITVRVSGPNVADLNNDTVVDGADLAALLSVWGSNGANGGDFNGDNVVNGLDLATMLANWGAADLGDFTLELLARN